MRSHAPPLLILLFLLTTSALGMLPGCSLEGTCTLDADCGADQICLADDGECTQPCAFDEECESGVCLTDLGGCEPPPFAGNVSPVSSDEPGPPGPQGSSGEQGPQGLPGAPGEDAFVSRSTSFFQGVEVADETTGPRTLTQRALSFDKQQDDTTLRVSYQDLFEARSQGAAGEACACRWSLAFNGEPCVTPGEIATRVGDGLLHGYTLTGYCTATASGRLETGLVELTVQATPEGACECRAGADDVTGLLEVEER